MQTIDIRDKLVIGDSRKRKSREEEGYMYRSRLSFDYSAEAAAEGYEEKRPECFHHCTEEGQKEAEEEKNTTCLKLEVKQEAKDFFECVCVPPFNDQFLEDRYGISCVLKHSLPLKKGNYILYNTSSLGLPVEKLLSIF